MQKPQPISHQTVTLTGSAPESFSPNILIFKTNIQTQGDKVYIAQFLNKHPLIEQWNIDIEDVDRVLRVVTTHLELHDIVDMLTRRGYQCGELL